MILGKDIRPERKIYYLGSLVIDVLNGYPKKEFDFFDVYRDINERMTISMNSFVLALDWLFILGLIRFKTGSIEKCF